MRALIFSLSYFPLVGGAEIAVKELTDRLPEVEFDMVTLRFNRSDAALERVGNVNVYRIGGGWGYLSKILFIPEAAAFAYGRRYDLYWAMMTYMLFPITFVRLLGSRIPYVLTLQDGDTFARVFNRVYILPFRPLLSYGFRGAAQVQAISQFLGNWARRMGAKEVEIIPNGVDLKKFNALEHSTIDTSKVRLITTSRLVEKNGVGDIIEALTFLPETVSLQILGTGPLGKTLKKQVESLELGRRVQFIGFVPQAEIPTYLAQADIFARPSLSEGQGISFIEAMAAGLPVIATPVGGIPDFLVDGETGLFCEPHNPDSIAQAVKRLIEDEVLRTRVIAQARAMVEERYDWDLIAEEMKRKVFSIV